MYDQKKRKQIIYLAVAGFILLSLLLMFGIGKKNSVDVLPEESTSVDYSDKAVIQKGTSLLTSLGSTVRYELLSRDLYYFAKNSYGNYKSAKAVVGFIVTSDVKKNNDTVSFEGHFGANKNKILVTAKNLNNFRLRTSITDSKTKKNLDGGLPSNNKRNQFIATLPITVNAYGISYDSSADSFIINVYDGASAALDEAANYLANQLGIKDLSHEKVNYIRVNDLSSDNTVVPLLNQEKDTE